MRCRRVKLYPSVTKKHLSFRDSIKIMWMIREVIIHLMILVILKALALPAWVMIVFKQQVLPGTSHCWIECTKISVIKSISLLLSVYLLLCQKEHCLDGWYPYYKLKGICIKLCYFWVGRPKFSFTCLSEMGIVRIALSILWQFYVGLLYMYI